MAPRKQSSDETPMWLKPAGWDEHFKSFDKLFELFLSIQQSRILIIERIAGIESRLDSNTDALLFQPHSAFYCAPVKFKSDIRVVDENACRITWVGIREKATEAATYACDREAVKEVIGALGEEDLMAEFEAGEIQLHRYPKRVNNVNTRRPRIIKIRLRNQDVRVTLLRHVRAGRKALTSEFVQSYARPDYTMKELEYDRLLRTKARKMNRSEGKLTPLGQET